MELHELETASKVLAPKLIEEYQKSQLPTLRDQFAMAAMQGQWSNPVMDEVLIRIFDVCPDTQEEAFGLVAKAAYMMADAMLIVREQLPE